MMVVEGPPRAVGASRRPRGLGGAFCGDAGDMRLHLRGTALFACAALAAAAVALPSSASAKSPKDYALPAGSQPTSIAFDGKNRVWIAAYGTNKLIRVKVKNGKRKAFPLRAQGSAARNVDAVHAGPKGRVYFRQDLGGVLGQVTSKSGARRYWDTTQFFDAAYGADGRLWHDGSRLTGFTPHESLVIETDCAAVASNKKSVWCHPEGTNQIIRFRVKDSQLKSKIFKVKLRKALEIDDLEAGPNGTVWFSASVGRKIHGVVGFLNAKGKQKHWKIKKGWARKRATNLIQGPGKWMYYSASGTKLIRIKRSGKQQVAKLGKRKVQDVTFDQRGRMWTIDHQRNRVTRSQPKKVF